MADDREDLLTQGLANFSNGLYEEAGTQLEAYIRASKPGWKLPRVSRDSEADPATPCIRLLQKLSRTSPAAAYTLGVSYYEGNLPIEVNSGAALIMRAATSGYGPARTYCDKMGLAPEETTAPTVPSKFGTREDVLGVLASYPAEPAPALRTWCDNSLASIAKKDPAVYVAAGDVCRDATPARTEQAVAYYFAAADRQVRDGMQRLGAHFDAAGNADDAMRWYEKAARKAQPEAQKWLAERNISVPVDGPPRGRPGLPPKIL